MGFKLRLSRIISVLLAALALQACKHPLIIVGKGDIIEANNSGHGCTLEQFQAQDTACTENEVSGDYVVNYKAEPRPGWRFVRWDGPCSPRSDFQYCRLNITEAGIAWWDRTRPGAEVPPSTAVFKPITGKTGHLVSPAVAGVAYETPTQKGVTAYDGSFQYADGETVQFTVGDTLLGEVTGQAQVTPFDLAGSAVITGTPNITRALNNKRHPYNTALNIAVLLQSLDYDANLGNGIQISQGVAALFLGVRLDMSQHWKSFRDEFDLRHALGQANAKHRFGAVHGLVNPAATLQRLYRELGIDGQTLAPSLEHRIEYGRDQAVRYGYDANGNLIRAAFPDWYMEGDDVQNYLLQKYAYNAQGNRTRFEEQKYDVHMLEFDGDPQEYVMMSIDTETRQYNTTGGVTQIEWELQDGVWFGQEDQDISTEKSIETRHYDVNGYVTRSEKYVRGADESWQYQYGAGGELMRVEFNVAEATDSFNSTVTTYQYDLDGRLARVELNGDKIILAARALGIPDIQFIDLAETYSVTYQYDAAGNLAGDVREGVNSEMGQRTEIRQYDTHGNVTRYEGRTETYNPPQQGIAIIEYQYEYNDYGRIISKITDEGGDGTPKEVLSWYYEYDGRGNVIRKELDRNSDGNPEEVYLRQYDADGYLVRNETPESVITYQYEATGWGHIFSPKALRNPLRQ